MAAPPTMRINHTNFWLNLVAIIEAISDADHVSIDLGPIGLKSPLSKLQQLDKLYYQAREATELYGVFQAGLTCSRYDEETKGRSQLTILSQPN